jgi:hypothetical protein
MNNMPKSRRGRAIAAVSSIAAALLVPGFLATAIFAQEEEPNQNLKCKYIVTGSGRDCGTLISPWCNGGP